MQTPSQRSKVKVKVRAVAVVFGTVGFVEVSLGINITKLIANNPSSGKAGCGNMEGKSGHLKRVAHRIFIKISLKVLLLVLLFSDGQ